MQMQVTTDCKKEEVSKKYWNKFYSNNELLNIESKFASFVLQYMESDKKVLDIGCGNGRDTRFFLSNNMQVYAIDQSQVAIDNLRSENLDKLNLITGDFVNYIEVFKEYFDYLYSRFTIHSINLQQQNKLIFNAFNAIKKDGLFFIEVRSINDDIFGLGEYVERNAYIYNAHYRRFIVKEELEKELTSQGFNIMYSSEEKDFAPFKESNPYIIRIIAKK